MTSAAPGFVGKKRGPKGPKRPGRVCDVKWTNLTIWCIVDAKMCQISPRKDLGYLGIDVWAKIFWRWRPRHASTKTPFWFHCPLRIKDGWEIPQKWSYSWENNHTPGILYLWHSSYNDIYPYDLAINGQFLIDTFDIARIPMPVWLWLYGASSQLFKAI